MSRIVAIWDCAENDDSDLAGLIRQHRAAVFTADPDFKNVEVCSQEILNFMKTTHDPIQAIESVMQIGLNLHQGPAAPGISQSIHQAEFGINDTVSLAEARIENIRRWRQVAVRGPAAARFRSQVTDSYQHTCLFSGQRLPKTDKTGSAGVDAAHILPWSTHRINDLSNGVCLNKLCHWAFDAGLLKFFYDISTNQYVVEIPKSVEEAAGRVQFDLAYFQSLVGPVPLSRLPANSSLWPSAAYLEDLNRIMFGSFAI